MHPSTPTVTISNRLYRTLPVSFNGLNRSHESSRTARIDEQAPLAICIINVSLSIGIVIILDKTSTYIEERSSLLSRLGSTFIQVQYSMAVI